MSDQNFEKASKLIVSKLRKEQSRVFNDNALYNFLYSTREDWGVYLKGVQIDELIETLVDDEILARKKFSSKATSDSFIRYLFDSPSPYEIALGLKKGSYISHGSAVYLLGLNDQLTKTVYVNKEQSKKPPNKATAKNTMTQEAIDKAFSKEQRNTSSRISLKDHDCDIVLLNGKHTDRLQVSSISENNYSLDVTSLERTLIDIAVRPDYSGGTTQVLEAYKNASNTASINTIYATLKKLNYTYPYHQVIGFYLEKAGFSKEKIELFKKNFSTEFDFYLEYSMPKSVKEYSKDWRLFYPKGL